MSPNAVYLITILLILSVFFKLSFDLFMLTITPTSFIISLALQDHIISGSIFLLCGFITCLWLLKGSFYERWYQHYKRWLT